MKRPLIVTSTLVAVLAASALSLRAQVVFDRILRAASEPQNWLTYSGTTMSQRYSPLTDITVASARGTSAPTGAKISAASNCSGAGASES